MPTASGRVYDVASKAWHDGQNHCWSGKLGWTFKNGAWCYGSFRWYEADGTWRTNAPEAPKSVACETIAGVRRQGRAHRRSGQRAEGSPRSRKRAQTSPAGKTAESPGRGVGAAGSPGRRQCGQGQRMQEVFPERRRNAACALHERPFVAIIGPPKSAHYDRPATTRAWRT